MSALPWVRFFPSDWLAGSRGMSAAETGVYISLIAMMYERGEPLVEEHSRLSRLCGASNSQFQKALESLVRDGNILRVDGGLWNGRVEKEQVYRSEKSQVGKQAAEKRWQKPQQKQRAANADAMPKQCQGNANQKPDPERRTEANASDAKASPIDIRDELWREGTASIVRQTGKTIAGAKSVIGKLLRDGKDDCRMVLSKIRQAEADRVIDPVAWMCAAVREPPPRPLRQNERLYQAMMRNDDEPEQADQRVFDGEFTRRSGAH
ncbi:YdaU family protein [Aureimonas glaciei]|uniref:DUF1376 domain-containing protein n=1 Tax=Aureimonas glaciei TaxID=1776957 RepID=A0A916Y4L6_9HYPH|nr:DUF1376 domain-containing protein [Aureimonas glaciei]GGD31056.1 hypothetical protein GCM10011335_37630 [Aureimonas glaciei]